MIRVLIVDDHALVRSGLRLLLESEDDISVDDEARRAQRRRCARRACTSPTSSCSTSSCPARAGSRPRRRSCRRRPKTQILVLSMQDDPSYVREAFASGASGYLLKEAADAELVAAVREVAAGRRYVHPDARRAACRRRGRGGGARGRRPALRP